MGFHLCHVHRRLKQLNLLLKYMNVFMYLSIYIYIYIYMNLYLFMCNGKMALVPSILTAPIHPHFLLDCLFNILPIHSFIHQFAAHPSISHSCYSNRKYTEFRKAVSAFDVPSVDENRCRLSLQSWLRKV